MDKVLFIDAHNAMWRACVKFGAVQPEVPDEVIFTFNFFRNLRPLIEDFEPAKCFFVLEGHPQFRYDLYPEYKANRLIKLAAANPDDDEATAKKKKSQATFFKTRDIILPLIKHLPITVVRAGNYEADDVVATLCENMRDEELTIISTDSDYIQLLQRGYPSCRIYNPIKKDFMVAPNYPYVAWKCLAGDTSDNIKKLLTPKKVEATMASPEAFQKFMDIEENRANFSINRQLIEFRSVPMEELEITEGVKNFTALKESFAQMKFESIINEKSWQKYCSTFDCIKY